MSFIELKTDFSNEITLFRSAIYNVTEEWD
jgi:hypothetical protein